MALKRNLLLDQLDLLRDEIKKTYLEKFGQTIVVCTDEALKEIANKKPLSIFDFHAISGLDNDFIDLYANQFLNIITSHQNANSQTIKVSKNASKVLHHYKDRLTNLSKSNANLYLGRLDQIHSFDMSLIENNEYLYDFLSNNRIKNLKINIVSESQERHITKLYREVNKSFREKGSYNLYITYPFVEGIFSKDKFPIKAPLLYFPVKIERTLKTFSIKKDEEKDIIFNRDLILATSKMEKSQADLDMPIISDFNHKVLKDVVIPFYEKYGLKILNEDNTQTFIPFLNELKEDFVKKSFKSFVLKPYITLSRFEIYSSSIQKDMEKILSTHKYNDLLEGLIDETNLFNKEKQVIYETFDEAIDEQKIAYINDLNYSQEKVIDLLNKEKKIVIWGPPGTGKSQTITSLIASAILKGENVLVVSEKKVALDVIYSRLKKASKYAMFVDDVENKQDFYHKLGRFLEPEPLVRTLNNDVYQLEIEVKHLLKDMDQSLDLLYHKSIENIPMNELFSRYIKDKDLVDNLTPHDIYQMFNDTFGNVNFSYIQKLESRFDNDSYLERMLNFDRMITRYPILKKVETKLPRSQKVLLKQFTDAWGLIKNDFESKGIFKKRKIKQNFIKENQEKIEFLTKKPSILNSYLKLMFKDDRLHQYINLNMNQLDKLYDQYHKLSKPDKSFLKMLDKHPRLSQRQDIHKLRKYIFDGYYSGFLEIFKANNQKYLYIIDDYQKKMESLKKVMDEKMHVVMESFEMELYKHALNFNNTKRIMDIKRILESQHKPSIQSFIEMFQVEMMNHVRLFMMTPEVVSSILPLRHGMFDLVIFDEASQMYVEKGIPSIYRAKKVVIAGDPKQLRPSSLGSGRIDDSDELFEDLVLKDVSLDAKSLLDLARYKFKEALLNYHYRSRYEELIAFSNHAFYDAKLIVSPNQHQSQKPPIEYVYVKDAYFEDRKNIKEAKQVVDVIKKIFLERKNNESIGVITFNSTQRDAIENEIDKQLFKKGTFQKQFEKELFRKDHNEDTSLFVKNIENVQGDERDIIIFSMGYAKNNSGMVMRRFGWLNHEGGQNRLNVAITRAKQKIYFVSSLYPEEFKVDDLSSSGPKLLKDFMRYCYFISNKNDEMTKEVLNQLFSSESKTKESLSNVMILDLKARLEKMGYTVESNVGIGRYKISLAVKDNQIGHYKLGIISNFSETNLSARRDLLHQEKYLSSRNWVIYRLFESNWFINPNLELKQIKELLKEK